MRFSKPIIIRRLILLTLSCVLAACVPAKLTSVTIAVPEADKSRYITDVAFIARGPRRILDPQHKAVEDLCAERLTGLGYKVESYDFGGGVDVIGTLAGTTRPDEIVIVSAHYDTIPGSNGADDNASGVAAALETARLLANEKHARTLQVACWDQEEPSIYGSYVYAKREKEKNTDIKVAYVYDEIGTSDDRPNSQRFPSGFEMVYPAEAQKLMANQYRANFVLLIFDQQARNWAVAIADQAEKEGLPSLQLEVNLNEKVVSNLKGSDHASFWGKGYPAIEINDTSEYRNPYKHTSLDTIETLNYDFAIRIVSAVAASVRNALDNQGVIPNTK
jgi:Zn-dependent M28 family amino/carboxypeptidase